MLDSPILGVLPLTSKAKVPIIPSDQVGVFLHSSWHCWPGRCKNFEPCQGARSLDAGCFEATGLEVGGFEARGLEVGGLV